MSFRKPCHMPFRKLILPFTLTGYIHTEKYSPKSYVVTFHTQMNSSQSEERTMAFTHEINDTSNKNRERCFFTYEKNDTSNQRPQRCVSFAPKFPPFIGACSAIRRHSTREVSSKCFSCKKKNWKHLGNWSGIVSLVLLSMKETVESRQNNSGRRKNRTRRKLKLCFLSELPGAIPGATLSSI